MKFNRVEQLVRILADSVNYREIYIDSIPTDISIAIIDNRYTNSLDSDLQATLNLLLPGYLAEDINWFLYEWRPGFTITLVDGTKYTMQNIEDYIKYLKEEYSNELTD